MDKNSHISTANSSLFYPPGGILVWILIIIEILTFLGASLVFMYYRNIEWQDFVAYRKHLSPLVGTVNTVVLITSGYFMANSLHYLRSGQSSKSASRVLAGLILGVAFLIIKGFEYFHKIDSGIGFDTNTFFTFYWLMTGFHFVHVLFGVGLLTYMYFAIKNNTYSATNSTDVESSATYWHMCDLIWILIFPVLYLI